MRVYHKAYNTVYFQRPEVKARQKAYMKTYKQRPEVKARLATYLPKSTRQYIETASICHNSLFSDPKRVEEIIKGKGG